MNNPFLLRRVALLLLVIGTSLSACKKEVDPAPAADVATQVAGQYSLSQLLVNGKTYPASETQLKGTTQITRETATTVTIEANIVTRSANESFLSGTIAGVTVQEAASGEVSLSKDGESIASVRNGKLTIETSDANDVPFTLILTK